LHDIKIVAFKFLAEIYAHDYGIHRIQICWKAVWEYSMNISKATVLYI